MLVLFFCQIVFAVAIDSVTTWSFPPRFEEDPSGTFPAGHLKAFGFHRPPDGPVVEERGFLHPQVFWDKYVSIHTPMVFRQAAIDSPAIEKWSDDYLAKEYGDLDILLEVKRENRSKNSKRMNISTFIDIYTKLDVYAVTILPDPMRKDVQTPTCLLCGTFKDFVHETNFWMSNGGTRSVIHYDADENIHCIINGSKDFMMINRTFEKFLVMAVKTWDAGSGYSSLDPDSIDLLAHPDMAKIQWTYATLYPGDCIYIPSGYFHQVRSYNRTISATILFTSTVEKTFEGADCAGKDFGYTPLSDIDVHWTYNKGDKTVDMGYINVELLRSNLLKIFKDMESDLITSHDFAKYYSMMNDVEEDNVENGNELFSTIFGVAPREEITAEHIKNIPREKLKMLARQLDDPHGPVREDDGAIVSGDDDDGDDVDGDDVDDNAAFISKDEL